jgi:hypothetical protein
VDQPCQYAGTQIGFLILIMWNDTDTPLAYFISIRTYGTWLHGDKRGSIDRFHNQYRSPYIPPHANWHRYNQQKLNAAPLILGASQRKVIETAIRETCKIGTDLLQRCSSAAHPRPDATAWRY